MISLCEVVFHYELQGNRVIANHYQTKWSHTVDRGCLLLALLQGKYVSYLCRATTISLVASSGVHQRQKTYTTTEQPYIRGREPWTMSIRRLCMIHAGVAVRYLSFSRGHKLKQ